MVEINGVEYREQELDGNTILVPVKKAVEVKTTVDLSQAQVNALFDMMAVISAKVPTDTSEPRWQDWNYDTDSLFSTKASDIAREVYDILLVAVTRDRSYEVFSESYNEHFVLIQELRIQPEG